MQSLWLLNIGWDENVPQHIHNMWESICDDFNKVINISIPRKLLRSQEARNLQLHLFTGTSEKAYGAYGCVSAHLIASKTRVAPVKTITIPKLELSTACLGTQLALKLISALSMEILVTYWTDSELVLSWLAEARLIGRHLLPIEWLKFNKCLNVRIGNT